jgi:3-oxoacyl-[acyl-carrier protein] reductase
MELGIAGRRAIVCGASKGLGRAAALALAREGVEVVLTARTAQSLTEAAAEIAAQTGSKVTFTATDITTVEGQKAVIAACPDADILVTNPGVRQTPADFHTLPREEWLKWLDMHFFSALEMIRGVVPGMVERRFGRIVNISVSNIKFPQVNFGHSHGARLALAGAIASMVRELIPHNVTINSVCPGFFDTEALRTNLHNHAARGNTTYEAIVADRLKMTPAGRFADPQECGDLIAFLCAAQSGYITGQNIVNDGGVYQGLF